MTVDKSNPTYVVGVVRAKPESPTGVRIDKVGVSKNAQADVKFAAFSVSTNGDNTIVAAVTGKKIRVLSYYMSPAGVVSFRWRSGAAGNALTGAAGGAGDIALAADEKVRDQDPYGLFETTAGELLNLELDAAVVVNGRVTYVEV